MRVAIIDTDIELAAKLAFAIKQSIPSSAVEYCEKLDDPLISTSNLVVADPAPYKTREWLNAFRRYNPEVPLLLVSHNADLLSGSFGDASYAMSKPYMPRDVIDLLKFLTLGKPYTGGITKEKSN